MSQAESLPQSYNVGEKKGGVIMRRFVISTLTILLGLVSLLAVSPKVQAFEDTGWRCAPYKVMSTDSVAWYHVTTCIKEDSSGRLWAQVRAVHSSGKVASGSTCYISVDLEDHSSRNILGGVNPVVIGGYGPHKAINCFKGGSETIFVGWPELVSNHVYIAESFLSGNDDSGLSYYLRYHQVQ